MNIEDLVTGALQTDTETEAASSFEEMLQQHRSDLQILSEGRAAEQALLEGEDDPGRVRKIITPVAIAYLRASSLRRYGPPSHSPGVVMMVKLLDWTDQQDPAQLAELHSFLRLTNNRLELRTLLVSDDRKISFLQDMWGSAAAEKLSDFTRTSLPTVRKWLQGGNPSSSNSSIIGHLVSISYQAHVDFGMNYEDIPAWLEAPQAKMNNRSIKDVFQTTRNFWSMPTEVHAFLKEMGADV